LALAALRRCLPLLPSGKRLPFLMFLSHANGDLEPELLHLRSFVSPSGTAIDVGANWGMYSYSLAQFLPKVYAFEINANLTADLGSYANPRIEIIHCGLSSAAQEMTLHIPILPNGMELTGWGSLHQGNMPRGNIRTKLLQVAVKPLDGFAIPDVAFIKIDVEGHEVEVLAGARETIERCRPTVLIEVKNANVRAVDSYFQNLGYQKFTLADLVGVRGSEENQIYIHASRRHSLWTAS